MSNEENPGGGEVQERFIGLLERLTAADKLQWAQSNDEPGFVYCWTGEDLIVFELRKGEDARPALPLEESAGIVGKCRNATYLWLPPSSGWNALIGLLRSAPADPLMFIEFRRKAKETPLHALETLDRVS